MYVRICLMKVVADLHLHSKYSRAVSQQMEPRTMAKWAVKKGINLLGTTDWTHPLWLKELEANLEEAGEGIYCLKNELLRSTDLRAEVETNFCSVSELAPAKLGTRTSTYAHKNCPSPRFSSKTPRNPHFILSTEISSIYSQEGKGHRIHNVVLAPSFTVVHKINEELKRRGCNLLSDGRPIIGLSSINLCELLWSIDENIMVIPAHVWTPWFSLYGSKSGFDSIDECFGEFAKNIYAVETGLSCYDEKTEVLTRNGWKNFNKVLDSDEICTLGVVNNKIEYQRPRKIFSYQYKGKMYKLATKRINLLVTPNHKLLVSGCDFRKPPQFFLKKAELLINKSKRFKKDGFWYGKDIKYFTLPDVKMKHGSRFYSGFRNKKKKKLPIKSWLEFFGFWIAEGWITEGKNGDYNVCLANNNSKLLSEMKKILESFGYKAYKRENIVRVRDYQLFCYLKQFGKAGDKYIPKDIKSLSKDLLQILLDYYIKGDGHIYGRNGKGLSATTISIRLRDDLQEVALKLGMSAYYKLGQKRGTPFPNSSQKKLYRQNKDSWIIYFIRKNIHTVLPSTIKKYGYTESWVDYDGLVYCVSVPNKVVYVRRDGIPVWCGNSDPAMNWRIKELETRSIVSFSDAHSPAKMGRELTVFELEELDYQNIREALCSATNDLLRSPDKNSLSLQSHASKVNQQLSSSRDALNPKTKEFLLAPRELNRILYTIEFHPEEGKYHYTGHRNCGIKQTPEETNKKGTTCPVCGRPLTVGVMHRVEELAKGKTIKTVEKTNEAGLVGYYNGSDLRRPPYVMLVPLMEILAESLNTSTASQKVINEYNNLTENLGSEIDILTRTKLEEIEKISGARVAEGINKVRKSDIVVDPGFDGVFGVVKIWAEKKEEQKIIKEQMSLL